MSWHDFMASVPADASFEPHITDAYAVTNILFSSGTTGESHTSLIKQNPPAQYIYHLPAPQIQTRVRLQQQDLTDCWIPER